MKIQLRQLVYLVVIIGFLSCVNFLVTSAQDNPSSSTNQEKHKESDPKWILRSGSSNVASFYVNKNPYSRDTYKLELENDQGKTVITNAFDVKLNSEYIELKIYVGKDKKVSLVKE